jgi:citrate synthase
MSMTTAIPHDPRAEISRVFLEASDALAEEFPHLSMAQIYEAVGQARPDCERHLPNIDSYRAELIREARVRLHMQGFRSVQ